jgi:N-acetylglucosaminyldiphosphoundecaprenol N-acetyl-beta-D-mannosaminyltransferase
MMALLTLAHEQNYSIYLFGAAPDVVADVEAAIRKTYPGVIVAGRRDGYFTPDEEPAIVEDIAASGANLLFVALPTPLKEAFAIRNRESLRVNFTIGVGGMFDIVAGRIKRAPEWAQRWGLEWVFRVAQEPRRLVWRYVSVNTRFLILVTRAFVRRHRFPSGVSRPE